MGNVSGFNRRVTFSDQQDGLDATKDARIGGIC
jgi:hypothetical protein